MKPVGGIRVQSEKMWFGLTFAMRSNETHLTTFQHLTHCNLSHRYINFSSVFGALSQSLFQPAAVPQSMALAELKANPELGPIQQIQAYFDTVS